MHERSQGLKTAHTSGFGDLSFERYLVASGLVVVALFTILNPSGSNGLGLMGRLLFWFLHAFGALALLALMQRFFDRIQALRRRPFLATAVSGLAGAGLFAPWALGVENLLGQAGEGPDGDALDLWAERWGWPGELAAEAIELSLPVTATWLVINLPWLLRLDFAADAGSSNPASAEPGHGEAASSPQAEIDEAGPLLPSEDGSPEDGSPEDSSPGEDPLGNDPTQGMAKDSAAEASGSAFWQELPAALGRDVIALSSQLHYLEVRTPLGRALVLYNLRDAVRELETEVEGLLIHRSHWVADRHVRRLARRGNRWVCELSANLELPVSRRRVSEAKRRWGSAALYSPPRPQS